MKILSTIVMSGLLILATTPLSKSVAAQGPANVEQNSKIEFPSTQDQLKIVQQSHDKATIEASGRNPLDPRRGR